MTKSRFNVQNYRAAQKQPQFGKRLPQISPPRELPGWAWVAVTLAAAASSAALVAALVIWSHTGTLPGWLL